MTAVPGPGSQPSPGIELPSLRTNVLANLASRGWVAIINLVLVPVYIHFVGIAGYGLVGFFTTLVVLSNVLDLGMSSTLNRELARRTSDPVAAEGARSLVASMERVYGVLAVLVGGLAVALAPVLASRWLVSTEIGSGQLRGALVLMGIALMFHWPISLYQGGMFGLQRHVALSRITVTMSTVRAGGAGLVLWLLSPTVGAFFVWQIVASAVHTLWLRRSVWGALPGHGRTRPDWTRLRSLWRFAAGAGGTSLIGVIFTQMDKVVLSGTLTLSGFGYYSLAALVATGLSLLILPVAEATYPRLSSLVGAGDETRIASVYHRSSQLMSVLVIPTAGTLSVFSNAVMFVWTGQVDTAARTALLTSLLVAGTAANGLVNVPFALQLAHGRTRLPFLINLCSLVILVPVLIVSVERFGAVGAASTWLALNLGYLFIGVYLVHRRLLVTEMRRWAAVDVGLPLGAVASVLGLFAWLAPQPSSRLLTFVWLAVPWSVAVAAAGMAAPATRAWARSMARSMYTRART